MNQALKGFGFLLQLCLLTFGLTAHALTYHSSAASADDLYYGISSAFERQLHAEADCPVTVKRAGFPQAQTKLAESGPYEKEEEEEVRTTGNSFKIITTSGGGTSAFFTTSVPGLSQPDAALTPHSFRQALPGYSKERTILYQVFRI